MTTAELRAVALTVKQRISAMRDAITPAYNEVESWELDNIDDNLPTVGEVKAALLAYESFEKPSLLLYEEVRTLKMTADSAAALPDVAEFAPFEHEHTTADISDFEHTHAVDWEAVANKPATFSGKVSVLSYSGNGAANRVFAYDGNFLLKGIVISNTANGASAVRWPGLEIKDATINTFTLEPAEINLIGSFYTCLIWG